MDSFRQLKIIFFALAAGQVIYFLITLVLIQEEIVVINKDFSTIWGFLIPVLVVILVGASRLLYNRLINSNIKLSSESEKLKVYQTGNILKFALLEGANLISITFYMLTGDFLYAGMFIIVLGIFFVNFPGKEKFLMEFESSFPENKRIN